MRRDQLQIGLVIWKIPRLPLDILKKTDLYFVRGKDEKKIFTKKIQFKITKC